ncbi:MAG: hypothetical protein Q4B77_04860 [Coriobacteriaceae bacterium]|nr:hypothetical protein [Coriobacteriaceae bacterium]
MLMVLALLFSAAIAVWSAGRASDVQVSADASAMAGANVVSSYHTAATVVDASVLSLGLTGFAMAGVGLVGTLVPGAQAMSAKTIDSAIKILKMRNSFARSASRGLNTLEKSLPYLVAANATRACAAQSTDRSAYTGTALAVPAASASEFPAIDGDQIDVDGLEGAAGELEEVAADLARASEETARAKEQAWLADCGSDGRNMQERVGKLSGLPESLNPDFASSLTWEPNVALDRARAYYQWRYDNDAPEGSGVEARADAAARHAFYEFAMSELKDARVSEKGGKVTSTLELLPKNTEEMRATPLYTDASWPSSSEAGGLTLHFSASCPGATGPSGPLLPLSAIDSGGARECETCRFSIGDVGKVPAASTSIDNGFEYHLRAFTKALDSYVAARQQELDLEAKAKEQAGKAGDAFAEALSALSGKRPRIAPPGRYGCVAVVAASGSETPEEIDSEFAKAALVPERGAVSAAVLAPDEATRENNVLSAFFSSLEERAGADGPVGLIDGVMDLWGKLLVGYGDAADGLDSAFADLTAGLESWGLGPVASWLRDVLSGAVSALDIQPVDMRQKKPVLTDSSQVIARSDVPALGDVQALVRSLPVGATDPAALLQALGYEAGEYIASMEFTIAEIPLPGGGTIPLTIRLRDIVGALGKEGSP